MVARLMTRFSARLPCLSTASPSTCSTVTMGLCSMKMTAMRRPMFDAVASWIISPPRLSTVTFTCGRPDSGSRDCTAWVTRSPVRMMRLFSFTARPS